MTQVTTRESINAAARELQRKNGCDYATAWRMAISNAALSERQESDAMGQTKAKQTAS